MRGEGKLKLKRGSNRGPEVAVLRCQKIAYKEPLNRFISCAKELDTVSASTPSHEQFFKGTHTALPT